MCGGYAGNYTEGVANGFVISFEQEKTKVRNSSFYRIKLREFVITYSLFISLNLKEIHFFNA